MTERPHGDLGAIRERVNTTRAIINNASRMNYIVESPALLDREALLRAVDAALAVGTEEVRVAVHKALTEAPEHARDEHGNLRVGPYPSASWAQRNG
ncbi:hypothetical protein PBI_DRMANHATTAN_59 [Arthrobacter phage DrManhattan]|uniref:Uncharacterized protein n=1 Tax=Arthrobacter phage DrManhattan TaxID=2419955 RepID=A0A3G2KFL5_9CAUD|nr:hypothetical protein HOU48_gp59 [Arthrobacter phage DrManhattan]AYN57778.1 hypothetical protein PBI_DRMANHATTAN_59 [Arthrobacter phage DrManhattan]